MEFKELGRTGVKVPEIGLGTWEYKGGVEPLRKGLDLGASLIDTAEIYGTESIVGEAIQGRRDRILLATKVSGANLRYDDVLRSAAKSLKRLGTDSIDLYQVHWPNPAVPIRETMRAMETLIEEGRVKFIGVSNFSVGEMEEAQGALKNHRIVSNQVVYSLLEREIEQELLPYCEKNEITVMAYSPLARGVLTSKSLIRRQKAMTRLDQMAREVGKTTAQVALNWCISRPTVIAIPKSDRVERVIEDCKASGWRLSREQLQALDEAFR